MQLPPYYPNTPATRSIWAHYLEVITQMDYQVADILKQLKDDGLEEDTIVIYWSDHGVGMQRAKRWVYDSGTHVPMIARIPEKIPRRRSGQTRFCKRRPHLLDRPWPDSAEPCRS